MVKEFLFWLGIVWAGVCGAAVLLCFIYALRPSLSHSRPKIDRPEDFDGDSRRG